MEGPQNDMMTEGQKLEDDRRALGLAGDGYRSWEVRSLYISPFPLSPSLRAFSLFLLLMNTEEAWGETRRRRVMQ